MSNIVPSEAIELAAGTYTGQKVVGSQSISSYLINTDDWATSYRSTHTGEVAGGKGLCVLNCTIDNVETNCNFYGNYWVQAGTQDRLACYPDDTPVNFPITWGTTTANTRTLFALYLAGNRVDLIFNNNNSSNTFTVNKNISINSITIFAITTSDVYHPIDKNYIPIEAGSNVSITSSTDSLVISATDTTYTAGTGIDITDNEISSTVSVPTYGAGDNISITSGTVTDYIISATSTTYDAGDGIDITGSTISVSSYVDQTLRIDFDTLYNMSQADRATWFAQAKTFLDAGKNVEITPCKITYHDGQSMVLNLETIKDDPNLDYISGINVTHYVFDYTGGLEIDYSDYPKNGYFKPNAGTGIVISTPTAFSAATISLASTVTLSAATIGTIAASTITVTDGNITFVNSSSPSRYLTLRSDIGGVQATTIDASAITGTDIVISGGANISAATITTLSASTLTVGGAEVQEKLSAGDGISISGATISCTVTPGATYTFTNGFTESSGAVYNDLYPHMFKSVSSTTDNYLNGTVVGYVADTRKPYINVGQANAVFIGNKASQALSSTSPLKFGKWSSN